MKAEVLISLTLDKRRKKKNGLFPVKLQVYSAVRKKQKLYGTKFDFKEKSFYDTWQRKKPLKEFTNKRLEMDALLVHANDVAASLVPFSFEEFEKRMIQPKGAGQTIKFHYDERIKALKAEERLGTASNYEHSQKSLAKFCEEQEGVQYASLRFIDVDAQWLSRYQSYMLGMGKSVSTIGIYLRPFRAIYSAAINSNDVQEGYYPFGKGKYIIPTGTRVKKSLSKEQLRILRNATPNNQHQEWARDMWFFSFSCNGMNMKDIAHLKYEQIEENRFTFIREKTKLSNASKPELISVYLNEYTLSIIDKYGKQDGNKKGYVFNIINDGMTAEEKWRKVQGFTRSVNQHLKSLCLNIGLPVISTYWARHTFATYVVREKNVSLEFIQESLGHKNLKTTQKYFDGFEDETKREIASSLMDF